MHKKEVKGKILLQSDNVKKRYENANNCRRTENRRILLYKKEQTTVNYDKKTHVHRSNIQNMIHNQST